jgi:quercetin dioxygenase-like cupin family protein
MPAKRAFWIVLAVFAMLLTLSGKSLAQDPTKVAPTHYKLDFENEHVQVVSVHYGAHEKSALHEHPGGVVVVITGGHLKFTDDKGKVTDVFAKPGEARWFNPFKHTVENVGDSAYNAVYIGIRAKTNTITMKDGELLDQDQLQALLAGTTR